ncbi:MAG: PEP-CTERM sorting domain-containing protein, partial [Phycisphaerae bacterium]
LDLPEGIDGRIMRMTFSGPAPSFNGRVFSREGPTSGIAMPQIPEPTSMAVLGLAGTGLVRRRR